MQQVSIVVGQSTVEWTTRMVDSDGELGGDLVASGAVSFACRRSSSVCGRLAGIESSVMTQGLMFRAPEEGEWVYQTKQEPVEEEDE